MMFNNTHTLERNQRKPIKRRIIKVKRKKNSEGKEFNFIKRFAANFDQIAPMEWIPTSYQLQIKSAKPVKIFQSRMKKKKIPIQ
jgi:hypothetical protein